MITKREKNLSKMMIAVQVIITMALFLFAEKIYHKRGFNITENVFFFSQILIIWSIFLSKLRLGIVFRTMTFISRFRGYLVTILFGSTLFYFEIKFFPIIRDPGNSFKFLVIFSLLDLVCLIGFKMVFYNSMRYLRRTGHNTRNLIIIADSTSIPFINYFLQAKDWGYHVLAILSLDSEFKCKFNDIRVIKNELNLKNFIIKYPIDDIFYCLPMDDKSYDLEQLIKESEEIGVSLHIMQQSYIEELILNSGKVDGFNNSFVTHKKASHNYVSLKIKDFFDIVFSIVTLILLSPFLALISILIKLEDGGPVFFKQERISLNGRRFTCYKFRSMIVNAEDLIPELEKKNEADGPVFKIENDPRITKIGRILRKTSLDELPQFYNVIKGDMSVVGPRPPLLKEVQQYERSQLRRLSMKPGITCNWQVWGRHSVSFAEWMKMDLDYIDKWSLWLDLKIMVATVGVIVTAKGQ